MRFLLILSIFFFSNAFAIDLNLRNVETADAIRMVAKFLKQNVIIDSKIQGTLSLNVSNLSPAQSMSVLLRSQDLTSVKEGSVLFVMPQAQLSKYQHNQTLSKFIQVHYAKAKQLLKMIKGQKFLSKNGSIAADERTNSVWIEDYSNRVKNITQFIHQIDRPVQQVLIKARIVNADKSKEFEIGSRLGISRPMHLSGTLKGANSLANGSTLEKIPLNERLNFDMPATSLFKHPASLGLAVARLGHGINLDLELSAMEKEQLLDVVASPRLIATHKQPALIEAGEEIPYEQETKEGATNASFKKAVLSLKVTPQITANNRVILSLEVNQDKPGPHIKSGLVIDTQHMKTQVLVHDQQTIVVGGIYQTTKHKVVHKVPVLGDLPLIGYLFRHKATVSERKELLIFITPDILK